MPRRGEKRELNPADLVGELREDYPELLVSSAQGDLHIRGSFPVREEGKIIDRFNIELCIPDGSLDAEPVLREIGGRIPWHEDWHINRKDGTACWQVPEEWLVRPYEERTIQNFLEGPVHNFFLGQIAIRDGNDWPMGERSHGKEGLIEAYSQMLRVEADEDVVRRYLSQLSHRTVKGHWRCPCGSGAIIRKCHVEKIRDLQNRLKPWIAKSALDRLNSQS